MTTFRFDVDRCDVRTGPERTTFNLEARALEAAEYEAEYCLNMFPGRHSNQTGRLYRDGVFVRVFTWTAVPW